MSFSVIQTTFQVLSRHMRLVATVSDGETIEHFYHRRNFDWIVLTIKKTEMRLRIITSQNRLAIITRVTE